MNLLQRFTLLGLVVTLLLGGGFGYLLSQRMTRDALQDSADETAVLVSGWVGLGVRAEDFQPGAQATQAWRERLEGIPGKLGGVRVKVWNPQGVLVYPEGPAQIGQGYGPKEGFTRALAGEVARVEFPEELSAGSGERLLEVYVPVRVAGQVMGVYQISRPFAPLEARIRRIQTQVWGGSLALFVLLFLALYGLLRRASREIQRMAYYDPLTGLPNRRFLREIAEATMARTHRIGMGMALVILDLDRFQEINDVLGPSSADLLLKKVGERLQADLRAGDIVCRLGGDEFALLVNDVNVGGVAEVAKRILLTFGEPFGLSGHRQKVYVQASLGVALYPEDGADLEELMRAADVALRRAKQENSGFAFYRPDHDHHTLDRLALQSALHQALKEDDLTLHYQSILDLASGTLDRAEALVRWYRVGELVVPGAFIPLAEETGLIRDLDRFVLQRSTLEAVRLGLQVSVNLSPRSLNDPQVAEWVGQALAESGLEPARLCLEITEASFRGDSREASFRHESGVASFRHESGVASLRGEGRAVAEHERAIANLEALRALGVRIALDDFGSGYSSLSYLKHLPVDLLKIAPTFIAGIGKDPRDEEMIRSLIALGHGLGLEVLAEGVETTEQLSWLREAGCDLAQGYGVARPVPLEILRMAPSGLAG